MARSPRVLTILGLLLLLLFLASCDDNKNSTPAPAPTPTPAPAPPAFTPANWKNGDRVQSKDASVEVTVVKIGPALWSYQVDAMPCPTCGISVKPTLQSVQIISNYVPDRCGNMDPKHKCVSTSTADWAPNAVGSIISTQKKDQTSMAFDINCDAKNGPIYLTVDMDWQGTAKTVTVGPMPGPIDPQ